MFGNCVFSFSRITSKTNIIDALNIQKNYLFFLGESNHKGPVLPRLWLKLRVRLPWLLGGDRNVSRPKAAWKDRAVRHHEQRSSAPSPRKTGLEGRSRSSDRCSRWKIGWKIELSGYLKAAGAAGRSKEEIPASLFVHSSGRRCGRWGFLRFSGRERGRWEGFLRYSELEYRRTPHLRRTPPSSKKSYPPSSFV